MWPNPQFSADLVTFTEETIKGAVTNDHLRVSKVSWKFSIPNIHNFAAI